MAIKMRTIRDPDTICKICGKSQTQSLEMFEIMFTEKARITLCDLCNDKLLYKTLKASCNVDNKLKTKKDLAIINRRRESGESTWYFDKG